MSTMKPVSIAKYWPIITSFRGEIIRWKWHESLRVSLFMKNASTFESEIDKKNQWIFHADSAYDENTWEINVYKLFCNETLISVCCVESDDAVCVVAGAAFDGFSCSKSRLNADWHWMPMSLDDRRSAELSADGDSAPSFGVIVSSVVSACNFVVSPAPTMNNPGWMNFKGKQTYWCELLIDKRRHMSSDCFSYASMGDVISSAHTMNSYSEPEPHRPSFRFGLYKLPNCLHRPRMYVYPSASSLTLLQLSPESIRTHWIANALHSSKHSNPCCESKK